MPETLPLVVSVIFLAVCTQSLTGFGSGLIAMAILPGALGLRVAAPLVALVNVTMTAILFLRFRHAIDWATVRRLVTAAGLGIPLGVLFLRSADEKIALMLLGGVLVVYAFYALLNFELPRLAHPRWAYAFGFFSGLFGGAFNTGGPAVVIYGNSQGWSQDEFRGNLQGIFLLNSALAALSHAVGGNVTPSVWQNYLFSLAAIAGGLVAGAGLGRFLNMALFRQVVLVLLILLGVRMIV